MTKKYKTRLTGYNIYVTANGKVVDVEFEHGFLGKGFGFGCVYRTDDVALQKAIEAHPDFGHTFYTDDVEEKKEEVVENVEPKKVVVLEKKHIGRPKTIR